LSKEQRTIQKEQEKTQLSKKRTRHPSVFFGLFLIGIISRITAMAITAYAISDNTAREGNPIFYMLSPSDFAIFAFVSLVVLYLIIWAVPMSSSLRIFFATVITLTSLYDMSHDVIMVRYHEDIPQFVKQHFHGL
jgi:hypothetical protein